ncbi:MAG: AMP-binding protein [Myxococcota bacterium]
MTLGTLLRALDRTDTGIRLIDAEEVHTSWAELGARLRGNALHFAALGVRPGDRVAVHLKEDLEHVVTALALVGLGAVPLSLKPPRGRADAGELAALDALLARYGARFSAGSVAERPGVRALRWDPAANSDDLGVLADPSPADIAFVQFSSGSLGDPKAVPIRHESLVDNALALARIDGRGPDSIGGCVVPLCHDMGWIGVLSCLVHQHAANVVATQRFLRRPLAFLASMPVCHTLAMPDFLLRYLDRALRDRAGRVPPGLLGRLRTVFCGSEPIRRDTVAGFLEAAVPHGFDPQALVFSYGLAESTLVATARRFDTLEGAFTGHVARVGTPIPGMALRLQDGTVRLRGPSVFSGYLDAPPLPDGWHDTGDAGRFDGGELCITGRIDDCIVLHGENLFPADIEAHAERIEGVSACVALSHGDGFSLYLVAPDADPAAVSASVAARFGSAPLAVVCGPRSGIQRTTSGKPRRRQMLAALREQGAVP